MARQRPNRFCYVLYMVFLSFILVCHIPSTKARRKLHSFPFSFNFFLIDLTSGVGKVILSGMVGGGGVGGVEGVTRRDDFVEGCILQGRVDKRKSSWDNRKGRGGGGNRSMARGEI